MWLFPFPCECPKCWAFNLHGFGTPLLGPKTSCFLQKHLASTFTTADISAVLRSLRMGKSGSDPFLVSAPVHRGDPSTNLKPRKNSLSEFKHSQQPQTGICMSVQLNPVLNTSSASSRCWCLKRAQLGKNQFPEVPFLLHGHLSQGCEVTKSGNYIPHTLVYENLGAEEAHHLNCSWGHLILILLSGSL